jgi:hypothetical protein
MSNATTSHPTAGVAALRVTPLQKSFRILTAALALWALGMIAATVARAEHEDDRHIQRSQVWRGLETWAEGQLVDVQVRVDGDPAPLYWAPGRHDRRYLQAFAGRNYSLVLRNNSGNRVAVLLAVDGLNVVNGEMSSLRSSEPMYVLGPWEQATIRGWRSSMREIRRFVFVDERRSYAERTGQANADMGWIRVLSFREQLSWWEKNQRDWGKVKGMYGDGGSGSRAVPAPEMAPQARSQESLEEAAPQLEGKRQALEGEKSYARGEESYPGTGWGDRSEDRVRRVQFNPERNATDRLIFRYEYASGLRALGIVPVRNDRRDRLHERDGDLGFARPPRW